MAPGNDDGPALAPAPAPGSGDGFRLRLRVQLSADDDGPALTPASGSGWPSADPARLPFHSPGNCFFYHFSRRRRDGSGDGSGIPSGGLGREQLPGPGASWPPSSSGSFLAAFRDPSGPAAPAPLPASSFAEEKTIFKTITNSDGGTAPATAPGSLPATWAGSSFPAAWIRPSFPQRIRRIFSEGVLYYIYNYQIPNLYRPFSGPFPASWPGASWPRLRLRDPAPAFRPVKKFFCPESIDFSGLPAFPPSFSEKFLKNCA